MKFLDFKVKAIILLSILLTVVFYWFELRPATIKRRCIFEASKPKEGLKILDQFLFSIPDGMTDYEYCLHKNGL